jgi:hypothetical protein
MTREDTGLAVPAAVVEMLYIDALYMILLELYSQENTRHTHYQHYTLYILHMLYYAFYE